MIASHYENGNWVNVTTYLDTDANVIFGEVTSLSLFAVTEPIDETIWFAVFAVILIFIITIVLLVSIIYHKKQRSTSPLQS
ncbi:MAG: hypothetical protein ACFFDI_31825 [Promethearchaeota archaeon]